MAEKHKAYLLLGGNIPSRIDYLNLAKELIEREIGVILDCSSIYESDPWGFEAENSFLNQVVVVETGLNAMDLLEKSQQIEIRLGRTHKSLGGYASRTIDIDILFFDEIVLSIPSLNIPHVQIQNRKFTLMPLAEIAPDLKHPVMGKSCHELLMECRDNGKVRMFQTQQLHEV